MPKYRRSNPHLAAPSFTRSGNRGRLDLEQKSSFSSKGVFTYAERENGDRRKNKIKMKKPQVLSLDTNS